LGEHVAQQRWDATAPPAAARIPGARLVTIERGGHLYLGAEARVRREVAGFIRAHILGKRSRSVVAANPR